MQSQEIMLPISKAQYCCNLRLFVHLFHELWQAAECSHTSQPAAVFEGG
jgi:hypothetical protein